MRKFYRALAAAFVLAAAGFSQTAEANFIGLPKALRSGLDQIQFQAPALAPFAYTQFCLQYKEECVRPRKIVFRGGRVRMDYRRWAELAIVNQKVNAAIRPERYTGSVVGEKWLIAPERGDCNDYAVTKRHELIKRGWSPSNVLLSEVVVPNGEHHLVVVIRTKAGDLVLDNLAHRVRLWSQTPYKWVRIQRPDSDRVWSTIGAANV